MKTYRPQEAIINFGQQGRFLGIILEGEAEAAATGELNDRQRLGLLKRGDFIGEMSLLTGEPTNADVIALEECKILLIPQETVFCYRIRKYIGAYISVLSGIILHEYYRG